MKTIANKLTPTQFGVLTDDLLKGLYKFTIFSKGWVALDIYQYQLGFSITYIF